MEKKNKTILESKFEEMEWKRNGIGMEIFWQKKSEEYAVEMERKWNGNGMEFFLMNHVEINWNGMEWKWNGIEMDKFQR